MMLDLNALSKEIHENNKAVGWWDNPNRCMGEVFMLIITEIAEATEAERKDLMDDKLPHRKGGEVELADALIRLLDVGAYIHAEYLTQNVTHQVIRFNLDNDKTVAYRHFYLCHLVRKIYHNIDFGMQIFANGNYTECLNALYILSENLGYDIESAMLEKLEFNKSRADHKRENRARVGGKKF